MGGVAAGLLIAVSLPPFGWWPAAIAGMAGFALLLRAGAAVGAGTPPEGASAPGAPSAPGPHGPRHRARARAAIGAAVGFGQYAVGLWWVNEFNVAGYVALVLHGMACAALVAALVPVRRRFGVLLGLPAALVVGDWIRGHYPLQGLPIGGIALGQVGGPLAPAARLGGTLLVAGLTALAGAGVAELAVAASAARRRGTSGPRGLSLIHI